MKITDLISECTAYDFKLMLEEKKPKSWLKSVSAFANGLGGSLFLGVDNRGWTTYNLFAKLSVVRSVITWIHCQM